MLKKIISTLVFLQYLLIEYYHYNIILIIMIHFYAYNTFNIKSCNHNVIL
jgi:hypothetical protein